MARREERELGGLREREEELGVPQAHVVRLSRTLELLDGELADRLQHREALVRVPQEALIDERLERVHVGPGNLLGRLQRAASGEDGETCEEALLRRGEQLVRPLDRRAQRLLSGIEVAAALEEVEAR